MNPFLRAYLARLLTPEQLAAAVQISDGEAELEAALKRVARAARPPSQGAMLRRLAKQADKARVRR